MNPLPRLALFLQASGVPLANNHYAKAVGYLGELYGTGYLGEKMGLGYRDDFMGPLTFSPNLIREKDCKLEVTTNVRMPRGRARRTISRGPSRDRSTPGPPPALRRSRSTTTRVTGWRATPRARGCRHC